MKFGVKVTGKMNWMVAKASTDANFEVKLIWRSEWGVGEHTDYGMLTLDAQDDVGGLEVRTSGGWIPSRRCRARWSATSATCWTSSPGATTSPRRTYLLSQVSKVFSQLSAEVLNRPRE